MLDATADPDILEPMLGQLGTIPLVLTPHAGEAERLLAHFTPDTQTAATRSGYLPFVDFYDDSFVLLLRG